MRTRRTISIVLLMTVIMACGVTGGDGTPSSADRPSNAIVITIIYAPESDLYLPEAIANFNNSYANGINPLTNEPLAEGERPIWVEGRTGSSGTVHQGIVNAIIAPNNINVEQPTIYSPSVSHWLALVNYQTGRQVFDLAESPPTALAPVVMAIWESRLQALEEANGGEPVGWEELLAVMASPNGWADYGIPGGRSTVFYGHTDPYVSSTALSTLIAEFYASALYNAGETEIRRLEMEHVQSEAVQDGVRDIEVLIRHYSARTTEFKEYIAQGPEYLDFVALEENDLIYINQGRTQYTPPETLVALYPKEGTFWHEHPFGIPDADWVTDEQRVAAETFTEYVRSESIQRLVLASGFRPVNPDVPIGYPIVSELGVDPDQPATVLSVPDPDVIAAVQASWQYVKKQGDILLVVDTSSSMRGSKLDQAKEAAQSFLDNMSSQNRVGLVKFNQVATELNAMGSFESVGDDIRVSIDTLEANGETALYDTLIMAIDQMIAEDQAESEGADDNVIEQNRIRAIVLLSDGEDTASTSSLNDVLAAIDRGRSGDNPILIIPVAYGANADIATLNAIARASATRVQSGDPEDILEVLEIISSYF